MSSLLFAFSLPPFSVLCLHCEGCVGCCLGEREVVCRAGEGGSVGIRRGGSSHPSLEAETEAIVCIGALKRAHLKSGKSRS